MLSDHEFKVLVNQLRTAKQRRAVDVDRIILEAEELRVLLASVKRNLRDQRDILHKLVLIGD